jgi:hypothetical protein
MKSLHGRPTMSLPDRSRRRSGSSGRPSRSGAALLLPWLLLTGGCAANKPIVPAGPACPAWTRGTIPDEYPRDRFLVGLGIVGHIWEPARGEEPGRTAALADIARQLRAEVRSETTVHTWERTHVDSGTRIDDEASVQSSLTLEGVQVVARCFDPQATTFYTLAVVEREALGRRLRQELEEADGRCRRALEEARRLEGAGQLLEAMAQARSALEAAAQAERFGQTLQAVEPKAAPPPFADRVTVNAYLEQLRARARVGIDAVGADAMLADAVAQAIAQSGLGVGATPGPRGPGTREVLRVRVRMEDLGSSQSRLVRGALVVRVAVRIDLIRPETGTALDTFRLERTGGGRDEASGRQRAEGELATALRAELGPRIQRIVGFGPDVVASDGERAGKDSPTGP